MQEECAINLGENALAAAGSNVNFTIIGDIS
jgi:hypothetical protein